MAKIEARRTIRAPREEVFEVTAHIEGYADVVAEITGVEFLSEQRTGVGTRFRETRQSGRRSASTELEVTEYDRPARIRLVADEGGSTWDTTYTYLTSREGTELHLLMDVRPHSIRARILSRFIRGMVRRALERDLDAVQRHFEPVAVGSGSSG